MRISVRVPSNVVVMCERRPPGVGKRNLTLRPHATIRGAGEGALDCRPWRMALSAGGARLAVLDAAGALSYYDVAARRHQPAARQVRRLLRHCYLFGAFVRQKTSMLQSPHWH
jgi:hypothetical protein